MPTFDVHAPEFQPYPQSEAYGRLGEPLLTAAEAFTLLAVIPEEVPLVKDPEVALRPLQQWIRQHHELVERWPVSSVTDEMGYRAQQILLERTTPSVGGTYRVAMALPRGDSSIFFFRTYAHPLGPWNSPHVGAAGIMTGVTAPDGYFLLAITAASEAELIATDTNPSLAGDAFIYAMRVPHQESDGSREWPGRVEFPRIDAKLLGDPRLLDRGSPTATHGSFIADRGGRLRFDMRLNQVDGHSVLYRGERISTVVVRTPRDLRPER